MATTDSDVAAKVIERLLTDPAFRAEFRRDPASACREAGLHELADEMSMGAGKAMMTLDQRESKSSLAGVMMAAAMEGVGIYQFGENILPHLDDVPSTVGDVLSRVSLPAIDLKGALAGGPDAPAAAPEPDGTEDAAAGAAAAGGGSGGVAAATAEPEPSEAKPPEEPAAAANGKGAEKAAAVPPEQAAADKAAAKIAAAESPEAKRADEISDAVEQIKEDAKDLPSANDLPDSGVAPKPVEEVGPGAGEPTQPAATPDAPAAAVEPSGQAVPVDQAGVSGGGPRPDPDQYGMAGGGGPVSPQARAVLENSKITLDANGKEDFAKGRMDPRVASILLKLSEKHEIVVSSTTSDHPQSTSGGSVSNHWYGRGLDIATVDGERVDAGSPAGRDLAAELAELDPSIRPGEVGTPWAISAPGFFTDAGHQDHIHLAFDDPIAADWKSPAGLKVADGAGAAPAAAAAPGQPVAAAAAAPGQPAAAVAAATATVVEPRPKPSDSISFRAIKAEDAAAKPKKGDSIAFMQAVQPKQPAAAPVASAAAVDPTAAAGVPADLSGVPDAYPGDDAPPEEMAAWMAKMAEKRGLPPELPVMASLVESGLKNLNFGHADSVGFFQMRVGIWNQGEYAGYPEKPELQVKWFLDQAEAVKKQRIAAGEPIDDPSSYGEWVADVERPAEQFRFKYQTRLEEAQGLLEKAPSGNAAVPAAAPPAAVETPGAPPAEPQGRAQKIDPSQFGGEGTGTGGTPSPETLALLENKNVILDDVGIADLKAGRIDPRVVAVLTKLSQEHEIKVSCMCSDHSKFTSGGSVSNHFYGRGLDIASVDGEIVNPGSAAARELLGEFQELDPDYRPDEVGSPWAISGPGYFTDAAHQDHLHLGFKTEIDPNWRPPADVAAGGAAPAAAPAAAVPGAPVAAAAATPGQPVAAAAAAPEKPKPGDSMSFRAVTAEDAAEKATPKKGDSLSFMAVKPAGPAQFVAAPGTVPAPVADAAAATAAGGSGLGASALEIAKKELAAGVKEEGTNTGAKVDEYLAAADVGPGNPWCAAFVTWALQQSGHEMEGGGWAAVQTWVRAAEAKTNDLEIVSAEDARPGDMVVYDWGGQEDFAADGHIGFLQSNVQDGKFTALEGNYRDAVLSVPRQTTGANVKFIRINGDAPAGAPAPSAPVAPAAPPTGPAVIGALDDGAAQAKAEAADAAAPAAGGGGGEAGAKALAAIAEAKKYMGTAYKWGGSTPDTGFDCSGLVQWAYAKAGIELPRVTYDQIDKGTNVPIGELRPGDLVFFGSKENPWHVGIALGDGKFLHAPKTGDVVKVTELEGYWESEFAGARRVDGSAPVEAAASAPAAAASAAPTAAAAASIDPNAVAKAQAAVERDAAEVKKGNTMMFMAVKAQEADRQQRMTVQFMKAIDPKQQVNGPAAAAAAVATPEAAAAAAGGGATGPTAAEDAAMVQAVGAPVPEGELALQNVGAIGTYPGDSASQAQLAQWLASEAKKAGLPPELPVMASLVESGVKNLKGGDADSAGFFQMRVGIWDNGPYKGFRMNPQLQAKWFIDNALAVKKARLAAGKSVTDPGSYGEWIADVERPAAQYRYKYQLRLTEARKLIS